MVKRQAWQVWVWGLEEATCRVADKDKLMPPPKKHLKKVWMICIKQNPHKLEKCLQNNRENLAKATVNFPIISSLPKRF